MTRKTLSIVLLFGLIQCGCSPELQEPIKHFELQAPKPYGYVIGDEIHQRILVETRQHLEIAKESIPAQGTLNRWLELKDVQISVKPADNGDLTSIDLTYQVFYAPLEVKMLKIPGFKLGFKQHGQTIEQAVPDWYFTLSPLHELAIQKEAGAIYIRSDAEPNLIDEFPALTKLYLSLAVFVLSGGYLAYLNGYIPAITRRRIFKQASKDLAKLSLNELSAALTIVHKALNSRHQKPLFKDQLAEFYREQPEFKNLSSEFDWFFNFSSHYFFSGRQYYSEHDFLKLKQFCQHCRKIERDSR